MEVLWNIDGGIMEKLRNLYVSFMEKILDWNMEKLCRLDTLENYRLEKPKTRYNGMVRETNRRDGKMFRKIADWASTESGKEVMTGIIFGAVGIFAVRIFCFLVCLATGYPADIWNIF